MKRLYKPRKTQYRAEIYGADGIEHVYFSASPLVDAWEVAVQKWPGQVIKVLCVSK